jgi:hypothetical protein
MSPVLGFADDLVGMRPQYPTGAHDRSQLVTGAFNEQDIEEVFLFLEEHGFPLFNSREVRGPCPRPV